MAEPEPDRANEDQQKRRNGKQQNRPDEHHDAPPESVAAFRTSLSFRLLSAAPLSGADSGLVKLPANLAAVELFVIARRRSITDPINAPNSLKIVDSACPVYHESAYCTIAGGRVI